MTICAIGRIYRRAGMTETSNQYRAFQNRKRNSYFVLRGTRLKCRHRSCMKIPVESHRARVFSCPMSGASGVDTGGWGLDPLIICRRGQSMFWPTHKMLHSFIQNCCWITLLCKFHIITDEILVSKMEGMKLIFRGAWNSLMAWPDWPWSPIFTTDLRHWEDRGYSGVCSVRLSVCRSICRSLRTPSPKPTDAILLYGHQMWSTRWPLFYFYIMKSYT